MKILAMLLIPLAVSVSWGAEGPQSTLKKGIQRETAYPRIVLYSVWWCPHCQEVKKYFAEKNIPYTNRDVELDAGAMEELSRKYRSNAVPVIVIGGEKKVLRGFTPESFERAVKEVGG